MSNESTKISLLLLYMGLVYGVCYLTDHFIVPDESAFIQIGTAVLFIFPLNIAFTQLIKKTDRTGFASPTPREDAVTKEYVDKGN